MKKVSKDLNSLFWVQFFGALSENVFKNALVILKLVFKNSTVGILIIGLSWFWFQ
jgi:hypothetical protein